MLEQQRFDAIKQQLDSAHGQAAAGQLIGGEESLAEDAEYLGHLEGAIRQVEELKGELELKMKNRKKGGGAKARKSKRADPYPQLRESITTYLDGLRSERDSLSSRLES